MYVRIKKGSLLQLLYPLKDHSPDKCMICGGNWYDHLTLWWSKYTNNNLYSPYDLYLDQVYKQGVTTVHDDDDDIDDGKNKKKQKLSSKIYQKKLQEFNKYKTTNNSNTNTLCWDKKVYEYHKQYVLDLSSSQRRQRAERKENDDDNKVVNNNLKRLFQLDSSFVSKYEPFELRSCNSNDSGDYGNNKKSKRRLYYLIPTTFADDEEEEEKTTNNNNNVVAATKMTHHHQSASNGDDSRFVKITTMKMKLFGGFTRNIILDQIDKLITIESIDNINEEVHVEKTQLMKYRGY